MIEWLSNTFDLRFYYWTGLNWIILFPTYLIGAGLLALLWWRLAKRVKRAWVVIAPLVAVLIIAPWVEELWIAWNFGRLCKKDAGIFITKTVEVEGFYDATAGLHAASNPVPEAAAEYYEKGGFQFYELSMANTRGGPSRVVHYAKVNGVWTATVLDHPTARYQYAWPDFNTQIGHKLYKNSEAVTDVETGDILGGSIRYGRKSPWFFVALDNPGMSCPRPGEDPLKEPGLVYKRILHPSKKQSNGEQ